MNSFEVFQLCGVFRPNFYEHRNAEDEITVIECQ